MSVSAFEVWVHGSPHRHTVNSTTAGKAKYASMLDLRDVYPNLRIIDMRSRKIGPAHTSERFMRTATYRGMPDLRCGEAVTVNGRRGFVVDSNESANFDVLFTEGDWAGCTLNCHPSDIRRAAQAAPTPAEREA